MGNNTQEYLDQAENLAVVDFAYPWPMLKTQLTGLCSICRLAPTWNSNRIKREIFRVDTKTGKGDPGAGETSGQAAFENLKF